MFCRKANYVGSYDRIKVHEKVVDRNFRCLLFFLSFAEEDSPENIVFEDSLEVSVHMYFR